METHYNNLNHKLDKLQRAKQIKRKTDTHHQHTQFYTRTVNLTNIRFSQEELTLLNNGLQYSIEKSLRKYWTDLIMETEHALRMLDSKMQAPFRILATKKLKQISASDNHHNETAKRQTYILKNINSKLVKENAMVAKADKGKNLIPEQNCGEQNPLFQLATNYSLT